MASEKITAIIESVKGLSVLELKELIDAYCEEFGVSAVAAAPVAAAGAAAPVEEEKTEFDVILTDVGATKMQVSSTALPRPSRRRLPRPTPRTSRRSWKKSAPRSRSSKFLPQNKTANRGFPHGSPLFLL